MKVNKTLNERKVLNIHQQHLESLPIFGKDGIQELNNYIDKFLNMFNGDTSLNLTSKIDGAPSVYIWSKLDGYPNNSIALKSFVSGPKTAMSSEKEIDERYSDRPDMAEKLKQCLKLSKYIPQGEAWQGDCLFTKNDLKEEEINGTNYVIFHPNKIVYAFSEDNDGYNKIKNADLGIAFHTIYKVNDGDMSQSFKVDLSRLDAPDNFYLLSPAINVSKEKKDYNLDELNKEYNNLKSLEQTLLNDKNYEELVNNKQFIDYWNMFENYALADKKQTNINISTLMKDLKEFILNKKEKEYNKKQTTLKTDQGKEKAKEKYDRDLLELEDLLNHNKSTIENLVKAINSAANIKMMLWNSLKNSKDDYSTFYKSKSQGYIPANKEGIAMSTEDGDIVKIVDRSEFSSNNRNQDFESGFAHESFGVATQGGDMGSFKSFTKVLKNEKLTEAVDKVAVVAGGRMNPPTKGGHDKVVNLLVSLGNKYNTRPKLFLTHTSGDERNPLSYESKIRWVEKAFGDKVEVVKNNTTEILEYLSELYNEGYNKLIYVAGGERKEEFENLINKYNGKPDKSGRVLFNFDDVKVEQAGIRDEDNNVSATMVRKFAKEKNFDEFKKYVPFNEQDAKNLFDELRYALKDSKNFVEKYLNEVQLTKKNYTPEIRRQLDKELDKIDRRLDAPDPNMDATAYRQNLDKYTGLFTKQGSTNAVVYSDGDIKKLYPEDYDKILKELDNLTIEDEESGKDYTISQTGTKVITKSGGGLESSDTTLLQEAISGLILGNRIKEQDVKSLLEKSDPIKKDGIFKLLNFNKNITKEDWLDFIKKWGKSFNVEQANKDSFISVANSVLNGDVNNADIIHDAINNKYSTIARELLTGADQFDKSDVYFSVGNTEKLLNQMVEFRKNKDIIGYVNFMVNNSDKIIGVSLKQVGNDMRVAWDIPPKKSSDFSDIVYWPKTEAKSQALVFENKEGDERYILSIRSNSNQPGSTGAVEWREDGGKAMMGKGASKLEANFGSEFTSEFNNLRREHKFAEATKLLLEELAGTGVKSGESYYMTKEGKENLVNFFNDSCGFNSTNSEGQRISAPYIKVY